MCSSSAKRFRSTDKLSWSSVLADEYLVDKFNLKTFLKADVTNNKLLSKLISQLSELYPLNEYKYKRVRKSNASQNNSFEILVSEKDKFTSMPNELADQLVNLREVELPVDKVLTRKQFDLVSTHFWPLSFHLNKYLESLIDKTFFNGAASHKFDVYARLALKLAVFNKAKSAAIVVDPRTDM